MLYPFSDRVRPDPTDLLYHYAAGFLPWNVSEDSEEIRWMAKSHRGVQYCDKIEIPKSQRRYVFTDKFEFRFDSAFDECVYHCATAPRKSGKPWITPELRAGYSALNKLGFAHSYEAWQDGKLVAGAFGVHIGSYITCESMFHFAKNSGTFCWGQAATRLAERGFAWIDTNCVSNHRNHCGEEWVPHWKFEQMLRGAITRKTTVADHLPQADLPLSVRLALPVHRVASAVERRLDRLRTWSGRRPPTAPTTAAHAPSQSTPTPAPVMADPAPATLELQHAAS